MIIVTVMKTATTKNKKITKAALQKTPAKWLFYAIHINFIAFLTKLLIN